MNIETLQDLRSAIQESRSTHSTDYIVLGVDLTVMVSDLIFGDPPPGINVRAAVLSEDELVDPVVPLREWLVYDAALVGALAFSITECCNERRACAINYWQLEDLVTILKWPAVAWKAYKWIQNELDEEGPTWSGCRSATPTDDTAPPSKS